MVDGQVIVGAGGVILGAAIGTLRDALNSKREDARRREDRLAEAYLDLLRIVERRGLWLRVTIDNLVLRATADPYDELPSPAQAQAPELTDEATADALLGAFGSDPVRELYDAWRVAVILIEREYQVLAWNHSNEGRGPDEPPALQELANLVDDLRPKEQTARKALITQVAHELGHRRRR